MIPTCELYSSTKNPKCKSNDGTAISHEIHISGARPFIDQSSLITDSHSYWSLSTWTLCSQESTYKLSKSLDKHLKLEKFYHHLYVCLWWKWPLIIGSTWYHWESTYRMCVFLATREFRVPREQDWAWWSCSRVQFNCWRIMYNIIQQKAIAPWGSRSIMPLLSWVTYI